MIKRLSGLMAAVVLVATAAIGLSAPAAQAAYCAGSGVGVVVDFGDLGGGVSTGCGSGAKAAAAFTSAGVTLAPDPQSPGFICRVQGRPDVGDPCMATAAYWALFVSKQGGAWSYANQGVYTQTVKAGDSVAFVWQSSNSRTTPGVAPQPPAATRPAAPATTAAQPGTKPGSKSTAKTPGKPTTKARSTSSPTAAAPTVSPSAPGATATSARSAAGGSPAVTPTAPATISATLTATATQTTETAETTDLAAEASPGATASDDGGLPGWVGPAVIVLIVALAGGVTLWRKQRS